MTADILPFVLRRPIRFGLTDPECLAVADAATGLPGGWHVQCDRDDRGYASTGLFPDSELDDDTPVFLVWRDCGCLKLGFGQGDFYAGLGTHADIVAVIGVVRQALRAPGVMEWWMGRKPVEAGPHRWIESG